MQSYRYIIFTRVSSDPQADPHHVSLNVQLEESRRVVSLLERAVGGTLHEVEEPIRLTQSTDIPGHNPLDVLREQAPHGYGRLYDLLMQKRIDYLIAYHSSRLFGRTDVLPRQLQHLFELARAQYYFVQQPRHLVPPSQLGRRGRNDLATYLVDALDARRNVEEIDTLQDRWRKGMTGHAREGRWRFSKPPWWGEREVLGTDDLGKKLYGPLRVIPERAEHIRGCARRYLEGYKFQEVTRWSYERLGRRSPADSAMNGPGRIYHWLMNPVVVGVSIWPRRATLVEAGPDGTVVKRVGFFNVSEVRAADLAVAFLKGNDVRTPEEKAAGVVVAFGQWEAPFSTPEEIDLWLAVQEERVRRRTSPAGASTSGKVVHVLSGLLVCQHCGGNLVIRHGGRPEQKNRYFYMCSTLYYARQAKRPIDAGECIKAVSAPGMERQLRALLDVVASDEAALTAEVEALVQPDDSAAQLAEAEASMRKADAALRRLDSAWLAGVYGDDIERYRTLRSEALSTAHQAEARLRVLREQTKQPRSSSEIVSQIIELGRDFEEMQRRSRGILKVRLAQAIERIVVGLEPDGKTKRITEVYWRV